MIKKIAKEKPKLINFKVTKVEFDEILERAQKYTGGNISLWLRFAGRNFVPKHKDIEYDPEK